jgi:hypothetical protein
VLIAISRDSLIQPVLVRQHGIGLPRMAARKRFVAHGMPRDLFSHTLGGRYHGSLHNPGAVVSRHDEAAKEARSLGIFPVRGCLLWFQLEDTEGLSI